MISAKLFDWKYLTWKRLIYDIRQYNSETRVHLFSDLEAFYDRQIPEIGGIAEKLIGIDRKAI